MPRNPANVSNEFISIVPLEMTKEDIAEKANYNFLDRYNSSFSAEVVDGVGQRNYLNDSTKIDQHPTDINPNTKVMHDTHELNNTSFNSTVDQEHLPAKYDQTYTLSNWTDTKTTEAPSSVLHKLNHSSIYMAINPTRPESDYGTLRAGDVEPTTLSPRR